MVAFECDSCDFTLYGFKSSAHDLRIESPERVRVSTVRFRQAAVFMLEQNVMLDQTHHPLVPSTKSNGHCSCRNESKTCSSCHANKNETGREAAAQDAYGSGKGIATLQLQVMHKVRAAVSINRCTPANKIQYLGKA